MKKVRTNGINKSSLQTKLIRLFFVTSIIPILLLSIFFYYNISDIIRKNTEELTINNLEQTASSLKLRLESYEDLLYQMYTDDSLVALVDKINNDEDLAVSVNQLRRLMRGLLYTKEHIRSITVITSKGEIITYDQLTSVTNRNSWIENFSLTKDQIYDEVSKDNYTHIFPTEFGTNFANDDFYLLHIAHRIIDYKDLQKKNGIVVISIDEDLLKEVCLTHNDSEENTNNFNFIVDNKGRIISYINKELLTQKVVNPDAPIEERREAYLDFITSESFIEKEYITTYIYEEEELSWDIVNVSNQKMIMRKLNTQQKIIILVSFLSLVIVIGLTFLLSNQLSYSIKSVVTTMNVAGSGNFDTRVKIDNKMPREVELIAIKFNDMLGKLGEAREKEKEAGEKQRAAEIKALEAQINPHFLYNTLDTINWMAIDKNEFDISNAITSLATILRYAITKSNEMVEVRDEVEWLKKYIYLQQTRLKHTFRCEINVEPEILDFKIHKLLLQPFIENAIIHGFEGMKREHILKIDMKLEGSFLCITIKDNGKGIEASMVESFNNRDFKEPESNHIGVENAISRLYMYYGEQISVKFASTLGEGTEVTILIPSRGESL
ncbi:MAG: histidine kinase [Clostridiaceae bacterium]|jgi:two-component system sensor histidine kinase YesM|nr:histidine kinase [Clostridiaceae bacterium]